MGFYHSFGAGMGDERDSQYAEVQAMAIDFLGELAQTDASLRPQLRKIAEEPGTKARSRMAAWRSPAKLYGVGWTRDQADQWVMSPDSESDELRNTIRRAMDQGNAASTG